MKAICGNCKKSFNIFEVGNYGDCFLCQECVKVLEAERKLIEDGIDKLLIRRAAEKISQLEISENPLLKENQPLD